ncbi:MAG: aminoglycoside phosphotransferase family protein [Victivallales bacterium]|nr:aminoglycoside phosphotransferase family protein [Victivallales bacterium]
MAYKEPVHDFYGICSNFRIYGDFLKASPFGSGHINDTYKVLYSQAGMVVPYVLQKVNTNIFKDPHLLMDNICRVIDHMRSKYSEVSKNVTRRTLTLIPLKTERYLFKDKNDNYWRVFLCLENMSTYDVVESRDMVYQGARAFGRFQSLLSDLPEPRLHETIPDFHNTPLRFETFEKAVEEDIMNRAAGVKKDIEACMELKPYATKILELHKKGLIPERICHNDTKLNNVMIDNETGEGKCVLDLDTVMPGFIAYDFGELVRTGSCVAEEDERDISKIVINMDMFEAIAGGFIDGAGGFLEKEEKENLVLGGILMAFENAIRFLADYLQNDVYFKIHRPLQNVDRTRAQLAIVKEIEKKYDIMCNIIDNI